MRATITAGPTEWVGKDITFKLCGGVPAPVPQFREEVVRGWSNIGNDCCFCPRMVDGTWVASWGGTVSNYPDIQHQSADHATLMAQIDEWVAEQPRECWWMPTTATIQVPADAPPCPDICKPRWKPAPAEPETISADWCDWVDEDGDVYSVQKFRIHYRLRQVDGYDHWGNYPTEQAAHDALTALGEASGWKRKTPEGFAAVWTWQIITRWVQRDGDKYRVRYRDEQRECWSNDFRGPWPTRSEAQAVLDERCEQSGNWKVKHYMKIED